MGKQGFEFQLKSRLLGILILSFLGAGSVFAGGSSVSLEEFAKARAYDSVRISPTGAYLAATAKDENGSGRLVTIDLKTSEVLAVIHMPKREFISRFFWANDERVVGWVAVKFGTHDAPFGTGQLVAMNADGTHKDWIYSGRSSSSVNRGVPATRTSREDVRLLNRLDDDDEHILLSGTRFSFSAQSYTEAFRLNIYNGHTRKMVTAPTRGASLLADSKGNVRIAIANDASKDNSLVVHQRIGKKWQVFGEYPDDGGALVPVAFDTDDRRIYMLDNREMDTSGLYLYDLEENVVTEVFHDPFVDISDVQITPGRDPKVIGVFTDPDYPKYTVLDVDNPVSHWFAKVRQRFTGYRVRTTSMTHDGKVAIIAVRSDTTPTNYFIYEVETDSINPLLKVLPGIDPKLMRPMEIYKLEARDGTELMVHLTQPEGKGPFPLIVHPHGGPHGPRDYWGYNPEVQMLASRGYSVLQVNFRGSGGYGRAFESSGYGEWGAKMQDDLTDATLWAIKEGFAERDKVCISGASYGGYASMMGAVREPDLYACVVAYAGVYDLKLMFEKGDIPSQESGLIFLRKVIGEDEELLRQRSPVYNLDRVKAPVLIVHGKEDRRVDIEHAYRLRKGLKELGKPYEWLMKPKEGHGFYKPENQVDYFEHILAFFDKYIGSAAGTSAGSSTGA